MGGNVIVINKNNEEIKACALDIRKIPGGIQDLSDSVISLLEKINKEFQKEYGYYLWINRSVLTDCLNGSSRFLPELTQEIAVQYKPVFGDIDIMVPVESKRDLWEYLANCNIQGYQGNNKLTLESVGNQINSLFSIEVNDVILNVQVDFEFVQFYDDVPTNWSQFSHSSSMRDIELGIKGVHHKFLIRSLVGAMSKDDSVIVCTPKSTNNNITISKSKLHQNPRLKKFSVETGIRSAYTPLLTDNGEFIYIDKKKVIRPLETSESLFTTEPIIMAKQIFKIDLSNSQIKQFNSFSGIIELMIENLTSDQIKETIDRYTELLWGYSGERGQELERDDPVKDLLVKLRGYEYLIKKFDGLFDEIYDTDYKFKYLSEYYSSYGKRAFINI